MKRIAVILALGAALLAISASQAEAHGPYVGLFADANHEIISVYNPGGFWPFTLYVWWLPGDEGCMWTGFTLEYPSNVIRSIIAANSWCGVALGCPGSCCPLSSCSYDWIWSHSQACYLTDSNPSFIRILPLPGESTLYVATCAPGYPTEDVTVLNHFGLNQVGIAAEPVSWGAIKGLYR